METTTKSVLLINENQLVKEMELLEWKIVSRETRNDKVTISFQRDTSIPYYKELLKYEKRISSLRELPLWPLFVLIFLSFALVTALLVLWIVLDQNFEPLKWILSLGLPAVTLSILASVYILLRAKHLEKLDIKSRELKREISTAIEELRNKYAK